MSKEQTRCPRCGSWMDEGLTAYTDNVDGQLILIERVPAEICGQCGETVFTETVAAALQRLVLVRPPGARTTAVPTYDFEDAGIGSSSGTAPGKSDEAT